MGSEHLACKQSGLSQLSILIVSASENMLDKVNVVDCEDKLNGTIAHLQLLLVAQKYCMLKLPILSELSHSLNWWSHSWPKWSFLKSTWHFDKKNILFQLHRCIAFADWLILPVLTKSMSALRVQEHICNQIGGICVLRDAPT